MATCVADLTDFDVPPLDVPNKSNSLEETNCIPCAIRQQRSARRTPMYEHRTQHLVSRFQFFLRLLRTGLGAIGLILLSLLIGATGYHVFEHLSWLDAVLNAAMILTGMGPVDRVQTTGGKIFATCYALFSGVIFLTLAAILFAPVIHRLLHSFHLERDEGDHHDDRIFPKSRVRL
jgi:hypothetical protein